MNCVCGHDRLYHRMGTGNCHREGCHCKRFMAAGVSDDYAPTTPILEPPTVDPFTPTPDPVETTPAPDPSPSSDTSSTDTASTTDFGGFGGGDSGGGGASGDF